MTRRHLAIALVAAVAGLALPACNTTLEPSNHSFSRPDDVVMTHLDLDLTVDFESQRLHGTAAIDIDNRAGAERLILDTWALAIRGVSGEDGAALDYALGDSLAIVGRPLVIAITPETKRVVIEYATTDGARGVQWLTPEQTSGRYPFLYTQSQSILARTWVPCQDTPEVRFTYDARVRVPAELLALMSASNPTEKTADGVYEFSMPQPIPAYLLALAVGDVEYRAIGAHTGVYAEPKMIDFAEWEFADMERMMEVAESMYGPYRWERFDVIVLPPSFPYGGMENPRLTFVTPILVAGDRSLVATIAHELAHSWSGNLVTNATWDDFWLNEGFTTYFERRIMEELYGRDVSEMHAILGRRALDDEIDDLGATSPDNRLAIELDGRDPDEFLGTAPYEKGYLFLRMLEEAVGRDHFDGFLRSYFDEFAFRTMTTARFMDYLEAQLFAGDTARGDAARMDALHVHDWVYGVDLPPNVPEPQTPRFDAVDTEVAKWNGGAAASALAVDGWMPQQWDHFLAHIDQAQTFERLSELDTAFNFSRANGEVRRSWFLLVIANEYVPAYPALEEFLVGCGRRWLIRPLYSKLAETDDGLEWARAVYRTARPGYHAVTATTIDGVLNWEETQ